MWKETRYTDDGLWCPAELKEHWVLRRLMILLAIVIVVARVDVWRMRYAYSSARLCQSFWVLESSEVRCRSSYIYTVTARRNLRRYGNHFPVSPFLCDRVTPPVTKRFGMWQLKVRITAWVSSACLIQSDAVVDVLWIWYVSNQSFGAGGITARQSGVVGRLRKKIKSGCIFTKPAKIKI